MLDNPSIDFAHQTESGDCRQKRLRSYESATGLEPQQRLVMRDRPARNMQQRLVMKKELVIFQSNANAAHPVNVLHHTLALLAGQVVELDAISPICLCGLASHIRLSDELVRAEP